MPRPLILYIDDDEFLLYGMAAALSQQGFDVLLATDGYRGIDLAKERQPDIILSDVLMPEISGIAVKKIINVDPELCNIPFVFLSGKDKKSDIEYAMSLGAVGYFTKPVRMPYFFEFLQKVLKSRNE
jgi:CheY-like chemotaxis protein